MNSFTVSSPKGHCLGSKPIWGVHLVSSKNGVCWVEACTWLLCWNSTIGNRLYQLSCFLLTKSCRYWLSSWLTCSISLSVCRCQAIENTNQIPSSLEFSGEMYHKLGSTVHIGAAHGASSLRSFKASVNNLLSRSISSSIFPIPTFLTPLSYSPILLTFLFSLGYSLFPRYSNGIALERTAPVFLIIIVIKNDY